MTKETEYAIEVDKLTKRYGDLLAVNDISFTVSEGEVFAFLGPNGAGKTTTVEVIETIRTPTSGKVTLLGMDVTKKKRDIVPRIGVLPQEFSSFDRITVRETIRYYSRLFCMDYELGRKYNLYVLSWLENVRCCVERKIPLYHAGQGAEKTKAHLGATLIPSFILFKHRQPVIDRFLIGLPAVIEKILRHLGFWPRADRSTSLFAALIRPRRRMN